MTIQTIKFSQFIAGGDLANNEFTAGLQSGSNALFNNPWVFLPPGTTAQRPAPSAAINYRLRFNTDLQQYEYYDAVAGMWTQLQETGFTTGPYVIYTASPSLPDAQNLGLLSNGILKQTITSLSATIAIAVNGVDYFGPGFVIPGTDGGTGINNGALTINLGSASTGYLLTSDSSGNATWQAPGFLTGAVLLNPSSDQTILNAFNLIMQTGSMIAPTMLPGNLSLSGNTLSSTNTNGNINLIPNGTGIILGLGSTVFAARPGVEIQMISDEVNFTAGTFTNTSGNAPKYNLYKSRSTSVGSFVAVQVGDDIGVFSGWGDDGTAFRESAQIKSLVGSTVSAGVVSGLLQFGTASNTGVMTLAASIDDAQIFSLVNSLAVSSGGSGRGSSAAYALIAGGTTTTGIQQSLATGTAGQFLTSGGASALPAWTTATFPVTAGSAGTILRSNGTNFVNSTATFADTYTASNLLYSNGANTITGLATANNGVLITSAGGVPSISTTLPSGLAATNMNLTTPTIGVASATSINFGGAALDTYSGLTAWTPVFTFSTMGDLSVVYSLQSGSYSRVGNLVTISFNLSCTPTFTTASGTMRVTGLPFTSNAAAGNYATGGVILSSIAFAVGKTFAVLEVDPAVNYLTVYTSGTATATVQLQTTQFTTGVAVIIAGSVTYMV